MPTVNERLLDLSISHAVDLQQYSAYVVRRMLRLLARADADLVSQLAAALAMSDGPTEFRVGRLDAVLDGVLRLHAATYAALGRELELELGQLAAAEAEFQTALIPSAIPGPVPPALSVAAVTPEQVRAAAMARPFQGRLLSEWAQSLAQDSARRLRDTIRIGYLEGETIEQIIRRVRGTRANGFSDGVLAVDRRAAEAVVRTAVAHTANTARDLLYEANDDLIEAVVWHSTLDLRTSPLCQARDNKRYHPVTHKPIGHGFLWSGGPGRIHWRCRSSSYPVVKSWKALGIPMEELSPGQRASMDGQVAPDLDYPTWLSRQSAARQDEVLGPTRAALMRKGDLPFDKVYTPRGELLPAASLKPQVKP